MKNLFSAIIAMVLLGGIYSCHCDNTCNAHDWESDFAFLSFSDSDLTSVVVKEYAKGTNFAVLRDSFTINSFSIHDSIFGDPPYSNSEGGWLYPFIGNDSTDYLVAVGRLNTGIYYFHITGVSYGLGKCGEGGCLKKWHEHYLQGYIVNGDTVKLADSAFNLQKP